MNYREGLLDQQIVLFRKTSSRNAELESRVEELERELGVWKQALKTADNDAKALKKKVSQLERNIGSLKDDNPLVVCLIDGDGNIFSSELVKLGQNGGHQAALLLNKGLTDHMNSLDSDEGFSSRGQIWLTVYCNKSGLLETLTSNNICTAEEFESFVTGFNQASPLFSLVDVGTGKERADEKIKECLRVFTRFPQTTKVFFGGAHDNGYISILNQLQNEGLLNKVVLLRGYRELAYELKNLDLPTLDIVGLFMTRKLQTVQTKKPSPPPTQVKLQDFDKFRVKPTIPLPSRPSPSSNAKVAQRIEKNLPLHKHRPPPCNFYYLADCKHGLKCRYGHNYILLPEHIDELRTNSRKWPCPYANRDNPCPFGESCCMGHACPKGQRCTFLKQGKCKFTGTSMHDGEVSRSRGPSSSLSPSSARGSPVVSEVGLPTVWDSYGVDA
ncbi:unnamed protein product [Somion occarium]|uniref:C3H1-type domain-containing protein n=1 Tax=Somion occarium TaxID=3059160 RepID=A0ABP1CJL2_9APHY